MIKMITTWCCILMALTCGCQNEWISYQKGDLRISVEQGSEWLHDFPLFWGIKKKNEPQIAIWIEDEKEHYLSTVYVSHKIGTQSWQAAGGNRRQEALPHWCHQRGVRYPDGLYLPTKKEPLTDGITGATPHGSFQMKVTPTASLKRFVVKIEVNHSTDFNTAYPKSAQKGEANYSGGSYGSGQPAVVYAATVDLASEHKEFKAKLIGHSSADGSDGKVTQETTSLTTALQIVKNITVTLE